MGPYIVASFILMRPKFSRPYLDISKLMAQPMSVTLQILSRLQASLTRAQTHACAHTPGPHMLLQRPCQESPKEDD